MVGHVSPRKKMSLRTKVKPPKPFGGDVYDDISSSILGDRTFDSSELEETSDMPQPETSIPILSGCLQGLPADNSRPKQSTRKAASAMKKISISKDSLVKRGASRSISRELTPPPPKAWGPGLKMTPANNKK